MGRLYRTCGGSSSERFLWKITAQTIRPQTTSPTASAATQDPCQRVTMALPCSVLELGMARPITEQRKAMVTPCPGSWGAALAVGLVVWGLIVWAVIFHRKRSDELPPQVRYNLPIEVLYTIVPFIMVAVLFYFTARDENYINELPPRPDVIVHVTGNIRRPVLGAVRPLPQRDALYR